VKRSELIRFLVENGCYLKRHGGRHDIYANPATGRQAPVARHSEVKDSLVRLIVRQLELKDGPRR
jgi:predicted RNA binding protein YcfA (HicA-like mRNA interferase family)